MEAELAKDEALVKNYDFPTERFTQNFGSKAPSF